MREKEEPGGGRKGGGERGERREGGRRGERRREREGDGREERGGGRQLSAQHWVHSSHSTVTCSGDSITHSLATHPRKECTCLGGAVGSHGMLLALEAQESGLCSDCGLWGFGSA